jgi:hypothetical protein
MSNLVPFKELESMASYIVRSRLFGAKDESQAMSLMLIAQAEGCHPMTAVQDFDIVQGRPARKTHSILARFQAAGGSVAWEVINATKAVGTFTHKQGGSLRVEWTFEQAKKAGLTGKDNWKNYPQAMLRARAIAEGVRAVYPGAIGGMLTVEEAQDMVPAAPAKHMGAAEVVSAEPDAELLERADQAARKGLAEYQKFFAEAGKEGRASLASYHDAFKQVAVDVDANRTVDNVIDSDFVAAPDAGEQA